MKNNWIIGAILLVVIVGGLSYWGYKTNVGKSTSDVGPQVSGGGAITANEKYFSSNANVMEFYQDTCEWCIKESSILNQLADNGYRVKPMNVGSNHPENQHLWQDYKISGTPSFVAKNGDRLDGYQNYDTLKSFLDLHK